MTEAMRVYVIGAHSLRSRICLCGHEKQQGHSFCRPCYYRLPATMRQALWRKLGAGYEQAFDAACAELNLPWPSSHGVTQEAGHAV